MFENTQNNWSTATLVATLTPSDPHDGDMFGASVAISGDIIVVGKPDDNIATVNAPGAVYIYGKPRTGWKDAKQNAKLTPSDGQQYDGFGQSVGITADGKTIAVGAPNASDNPITPGSVYIFTKPATGPWKSATQTAELTASDGAIGDALGFSVAISGNTVVAGAPVAAGYEGKAYVFTEPPGGWSNMTQTAELSPLNPGGNDQFGISVAITGGTVVVGTPNYSNLLGGALMYMEPTRGWVDATQTATLNPPPGGWRAFGSSVSINSTGNTVAVGAPRTYIGMNRFQGAAFVFYMPSGGWAGTLRAGSHLTASDGAAFNYFGTSVAISGTTIVAGAPNTPTTGTNADQGAAYVYAQVP